MGGERNDPARLPTVVIVGKGPRLARVLRELEGQPKFLMVRCERAEDLRAVLAEAEADALSLEAGTERAANTDHAAESQPTDAASRRSTPRARTSSIRRRTRSMSFGPACIDMSSGELVGPNGRERLTSTELRLAEYLHRADGPRPAKRIALELFERMDASCENLVHKHIGNLRAKLACAGAVPQPIARLALGYFLESPLRAGNGNGRAR